jgi:peptidoglycan/LPS O-acetylase OafA/YrhL
VDALQLFIHIDNAALHKPFSGPGEGMGAMVANVFLIHSMGVLDTLAFNGPSWSISVEFYTYVLFAIILTYTGQLYRHAIIFLAIVSMLIVFFNHEDLYAKLDYGFFRCIYGFACGAIVWEIYQKFNSSFQLISKNTFFINTLELILLTLSAIYISWFSFDSLSFFAPIIFGLIVFLFAFEGGYISSFLKNRVFLLLGALSYSIYMTHIFISGKLFALPIRMIEGRFGWNITKDVNGVSLYGQSLLTGTILELFYLLIVILCSYISYKIVEEPFRNLSKKIVKNKTNNKTSKKS